MSSRACPDMATKSIQVKSYLYHLSITAMEDMGVDIGDNGLAVSNYYGQAAYENLLSCLTNNQRKVALLLNEGYTRKETAHTLGISLQAIHQIVLRIRSRLIEKAQVRRI